MPVVTRLFYACIALLPQFDQARKEEQEANNLRRRRRRLFSFADDTDAVKGGAYLTSYDSSDSSDEALRAEASARVLRNLPPVHLSVSQNPGPSQSDPPPPLSLLNDPHGGPPSGVSSGGDAVSRRRPSSPSSQTVAATPHIVAPLSPKRSPSGWSEENSGALEASLDSFLKDALEAAKQEDRARDVLQRKPQANKIADPGHQSSGDWQDEESEVLNRKNKRSGRTSEINFDSLVAQAELLDFADSVAKDSGPDSRHVTSMYSHNVFIGRGEESTSETGMRELAEEEQQLRRDMADLMGQIDSGSSSSFKGPQLRSPSRPVPLSASRARLSGKPSIQIGASQQPSDYKRLLDDVMGLEDADGPFQTDATAATFGDLMDFDDYAAGLRGQIQRDGTSRPSSLPTQRPSRLGEGRHNSMTKKQVRADMRGFLNDLMEGEVPFQEAPAHRQPNNKGPFPSASGSRGFDGRSSLIKVASHVNGGDEDQDDDLSELMRSSVMPTNAMPRRSIQDAKINARPSRPSSGKQPSR